jgi:hypothetical protein
VRRFLTVSLLLLLFAVLLRKSVDQPLQLPMPPSADDERARLIAAYAAEQDLEPADGPFSPIVAIEPYDLALRDALLPPRGYRKCQLVSVPAFEPEWAVYLTREEGSTPHLVSRRMSDQLRAAMAKVINESGWNRSYSTARDAQSAALKHLRVKVDTSRAAITAETADQLEGVWSLMLERVRYPSTPWEGEDGVRYHVSHWFPGRVLSGQTWSPPEGSRPYRLVKLAEQMHALTLTPSKDGEERLQAAASALLSALK